MSDEVEEEGVVPSGAFELGAQGCFGIGMSADDVEGEPAHDGQVCRSVVFATARQILVENDVEWPVQGILDGPVGADDAQEIQVAGDDRPVRRRL